MLNEQMLNFLTRRGDRKNKIKFPNEYNKLLDMIFTYFFQIVLTLA